MPAGVGFVNEPAFQEKPFTWPLVEVTVVNKTGTTLNPGDVRRFNTLFLNSATDADEGSQTSIFAELHDHDTDATHDPCLIACVVQETLTDGQEGKAVLRGIVDAYIGGSQISGAGLTHSNGTRQLDAATPGDRVIALALGALSATSLGTVLFDGVRGFGRGKAA